VDYRQSLGVHFKDSQELRRKGRTGGERKN
jgi:hypothetical protein